MKTAFIFPAFISEYLGTEIQTLDLLNANFEVYLAEISRITGDNFSSFSIDDIAFTEDELRSQLISYAFSCCLSDALHGNGIKPDYLAGYSMGIYAALFTGNAIEFGDGVELIRQAFTISKESIKGFDAGMGSIVGLSEAEINELTVKNNLAVEIANTNNDHAYLVTGKRMDVSLLLELSQNLGALNATLLNVKTPYHSNLLKETEEIFRQYIFQSIKIKNSSIPLISSISQQIISSTDLISKELTDNLFKRINWLDTFKHLLDQNVQVFIECGAGKSLHKIARFIPGEYKLYPMNKLDSLLQK
jgi:[acyl-carrier-protein] S-malonyltransferase